MQTISERQQNLITEFAHLDGWEARYKHIIDRGKAMAALPESEKSEDLLVRGCQSQVWLKASQDENNRIQFCADSDALIVKGLVAILLDVFSDATADEILAAKVDFLDVLGLKSHLSPSRANGLVAMVKQIKYYAAAFKIRDSK